MQELILADQKIVRSIFHALRNYAIELGYYPNMSDYPNLKTPEAIAAYKARLNNIRNTKGFYIDFFSESSARNKGEKIAPMIVVSLDRSFNGDIGAPPEMIMAGEIEGTFRNGTMPGRAANLIIAVYLISHNSTQTYVLNGIKDNILSERGYIPFYDDPTLDPIYAYRTGYYNLDDPTENITERAYLYTVPDVYLGATKINRDNIQPIIEIKTEIESPQDPGFILPDNN